MSGNEKYSAAQRADSVRALLRSLRGLVHDQHFDDRETKMDLEITLGSAEAAVVRWQLDLAKASGRCGL